MTFLRRAPFIRRRGAGGGVSQFAYSGTLTAGTYQDLALNNYYGYSTNIAFGFGSISPSSAIIVDAYDVDFFPTPICVLNISTAPDPGKFSINYMNYNGTILNVGSSSYAYDNGSFIATWTWTTLMGFSSFIGVAKTFIIG